MFDIIFSKFHTLKKNLYHFSRLKFPPLNVCVCEPFFLIAPSGAARAAAAAFIYTAASTAAAAPGSELLLQDVIYILAIYA